MDPITADAAAFAAYAEAIEYDDALAEDPVLATLAPEACMGCGCRVVPWFAVCFDCAGTDDPPCAHDGPRYRWTSPAGVAHLACLDCGSVIDPA